jgi:hypothetical protein
LWVIFAFVDPDPNPDSEYGSGSTDLIESGSETLHERAAATKNFKKKVLNDNVIHWK